VVPEVNQRAASAMKDQKSRKILCVSYTNLAATPIFGFLLKTTLPFSQQGQPKDIHSLVLGKH
jgi:hypothetical protein